MRTKKIKYPKNTMIFVKTTEDCNLRCEHCYLGMEKPKDIFDPYETARWLKKYQEETESEIQLCIHGGEPLMVDPNLIHKFINRIEDMARKYANELGKTIHIYSKSTGGSCTTWIEPNE